MYVEWYFPDDSQLRLTSNPPSSIPFLSEHARALGVYAGADLRPGQPGPRPGARRRRASFAVNCSRHGSDTVATVDEGGPGRGRSLGPPLRICTMIDGMELQISCPTGPYNSNLPRASNKVTQ